jgi:hypothetical protein
VLHDNVPAVGNVFAARTGALRSKDQGCKNAGGGWRGNEAKRNDLADRNPEPPTGDEALTVLLYDAAANKGERPALPFPCFF